jgi:shikimate kinase
MAEPFLRVFLLGLRGTGKSTLAPLLAERLGWDWCDMDREIERRSGQSLREIFEREGESAFRDLESALLREICTRSHLVVATGGGEVLREENRRLLRQNSRCVWLRASVPVMLARLQSDPATLTQRPALTQLPPQEEIRQLLEQREPLYRACADLIVDTDQATPEQLASQIAQRLLTDSG